MLRRRSVLLLAAAFLLVSSLWFALPANATIAYRSASSASNGAGASTITIDKPSGAAEGDVLLLFLGIDGGNGATMLSGWTQLRNTTIAGDLTQVVAYKVVTAAESSVTSYEWTLGASVRATGGIIAYSGVDNSQPIDVDNGQTYASGATLTSPSVTTTVADAMIVAGFTTNVSSTHTAGSSMTQRFQVTSSGGGSSTSKLATSVQDIAQASAGISGGKVATATASAVNIGQTVALRPAPPPTFTQTAYRWFNNVNAGNFSTVASNPTAGTDAIYAATNDSSYIYTTGYYSSNGNDWRIEKRNLSDGALVSGFGSSGVVTVNVSANDDRAWGIDQDSSYLYVVGQDATISSVNTQWRIEKRDKTTGALVSGFGSSGVVQLNQTSGLDIPKEVKVDDSYVYIAGFDNTGGGAWRIEKRDKTTGALVSGFGSSGAVVADYEATENDEIAAMVIDADNIYVGGFDYASGVTNSQSRIEKRDKTTGALVSGFGSSGAVVENPFTGNSSSTVDDGVVHKGLVLSGGNLYIAASQGVTGSTDFQWRVTKRDATTGALVTGFGSSGIVNVNPSTAIDNPTSIRTDGTSLFVAGFDRTLDSGMSQWRIEKRDMSSGALVPGFGSSGTVTSNPSTSHDELRDMVISGNNVFPVGYDFSAGNYQMRIEKRSLASGNGPSDDALPRAAQDTPVTSVAVNEQVRLRALVRVGTSVLTASGQQFKLQFAERSGTCDTSFSGETYADVTTTTAIALYGDNSAISDAAAVVANVNDPTDGSNPVVMQEYDESGLFTNSQSSITINSNGLWDISLYNRSAPEGKTYCFRVVASDGTALSSYSTLPELSTPIPPLFTQANYRWFNNADSASPGSVLASQDVAATIAAQTPFRLRNRIAVDTGVLSTAGHNFKLQYAERSAVCDASFSGETYADVGYTTSVSKIAGAAVNNSSYGVMLWTQPENVTADDSLEAYVTAVEESPTYYIATSNHGFAIPSPATIDGIELIIDRTMGGTAYDSSIKLIKGGIIGTTNRADGSQWSNASGNYGGPTDLWGTTWTPADINASNFGAAVSASVSSASSALVDHVTIKVYYSVPGTIEYHDNTSVAHGASVSSTVNDPTNGARSTVLQSYGETDPFTNNVAAIPAGSDGLWDFALTSSSAANGKTYCLRTVKSDGSLLGTYSQIPEITIGSAPAGLTLDQMTRGGQGVVNGVKSPFSW